MSNPALRGVPAAIRMDQPSAAGRFADYAHDSLLTAKSDRNTLQSKLLQDQAVSGISKTIPAKAGMARIESLYDGSIAEYEFHMAGTPSRLAVGDYVYTIFNDTVFGRLKITRIEGGAVHPSSGRPRSLIFVATPGERVQKPYARKGHRGTRYYDGSGFT